MQEKFFFSFEVFFFLITLCTVGTRTSVYKDSKPLRSTVREIAKHLKSWFFLAFLLVDGRMDPYKKLRILDPDPGGLRILGSGTLLQI
jgi:hypothetical protein